jgi:hypothetical protein
VVLWPRFENNGAVSDGRPFLLIDFSTKLALTLCGFMNRGQRTPCVATQASRDTAQLRLATIMLSRPFFKAAQNRQNWQ